LTEYGGYTVETQQDGRKIRVRASSDTKKPRVTPSEYPAFRQFARELDEAQEKEIVLAPAP
jgi:hypothetical protein